MCHHFPLEMLALSEMEEAMAEERRAREDEETLDAEPPAPTAD